MSTSLLTAKAALAAASAAVALGGAAAAAYAGVLPAPAQEFAHHAIGAPSPAPSHDPDGKQAAAHGPDATGPAAFGLCTAYTHAKVHGTATQKAVAFRNLTKAAGGAADVAAFCAAVPHPGRTQPGQPASHPTGRPSSHPTGRPSSHPTGRPSSHPTGRPSSHPTGKPA